MVDVKFSSTEISILNSGTILDILGVFRLTMINYGKLSKDHFSRLVFTNFNMESDDLKSRIEVVWKKSIYFFNKIGLLIKYTDDTIYLRDPIDDLFEEIENGKTRM